MIPAFVWDLDFMNKYPYIQLVLLSLSLFYVFMENKGLMVLEVYIDLMIRFF